MNKKLKFYILSIGLVLGVISTLGYCSMFDLFNKSYCVEYPLQIQSQGLTWHKINTNISKLALKKKLINLKIDTFEESLYGADV